ncbi:MAG: hypothetical protein AAGL24_18665 [Pseudomonadota bacterium]
MFAATLLFCLHLGSAAPQCGLLVDRRGPHPDVSACRVRLDAMAQDFDALMASRGYRGKIQKRGFCRKALRGSRV